MPSVQQPKNLSHAVVVTTTYRVGMLSVKPSTRNSCSLATKADQAVLLLPCLPDLTGNVEIDGQRQSKTSTFHTLAERHGVLLTISLVGHETPLVTVRFQLMLLHHSSLETESTRVPIASHHDSYQMKFLTFGGHRHHHQLTSLEISPQQSLQPPSNTQNQVKLRDLILYARSL